MVWRPLDIGYEPPDSGEAPHMSELEPELRRVRMNALQDAVVSAIMDEKNPDVRKSKIARLKSLGFISDVDDDNALRVNIVQGFQNFARREDALPERWQRHLFFEAAKLLVTSGVLRLNTCRDWLVDRKNPAQNIGLKSFGALETVLWDKYGKDTDTQRFFHLHSGSGDNSGVYLANKRSNNEDRSWRHVGFGNKLYAPVETLIGQFLKKELRDRIMHPNDPKVQIVIRILTEAIQKKLHEKWYSPKKGVTEGETWTPVSQEQDFNEIFELLRNPETLLSGINFPHAVSIHVAKYQLSGRFTGDKPTSVSDTSLVESQGIGEEHRMMGKPLMISKEDAVLDAYTMLMELSGMPDTLIQSERYEYLEKDAEATLGRISHVLERIKKMRKMYNNGNADQAETLLKKLETDIQTLLPSTMADSLLSCPNIEAMWSKINEEKTNYLKRLKWLQGKSTEKPERADDLKMTLPEAQQQLTEYDRLLWSERTLEWTLGEIRQVEGPLPKKLEGICKNALKNAASEFQPNDESREALIKSIAEYLAHIRGKLSEYVAPKNNKAHKVFEKLFEPEFVAAVERGNMAKPLPSRWELFDASKLDTQNRIRMGGISPKAFVRANDMLVEKERQKIPGTDFWIWRAGSFVIIDGKDVSRGKPQRKGLADGAVDYQTAFALEVTSALDLNERPYAYLRNFVPGDFNEITDHLPNESFSLISAIRSDSHIGDEEFTHLTADYIKLLQPGGCVITDGIEESYSQVIRLVADMPEDIARVEIVMSEKTHRPIALFIQKAHEKGYLTKEEKEKAFQEKVYFKSPSDIANLRPDLEIRRDICNELRAVCGHSAFTWVQDQISLDETGSPSRLKELITAAVVGQKLMQEPTLATDQLNLSVARHLINRHHLADGNPQPKLLNKKLESKTPEELAKLLPSIRSISHKTVWNIRRLLLEHLKPEEETSDVVQGFEKAIVQAFCDEEIVRENLAKTSERNADMPHLEDDFRKAITPITRRAKMEELFKEGQNIKKEGDDILYGKTPILTGADIGYIQRRTADRSIRAIDKGRHLIDPEHNPLRHTPGVIRQFRRKGTDWELPEVRTTLLWNNNQFATPEAKIRLIKKQENVRKIAQELAEASGHPPIGFIQFTDCVTNDLLLDRLREIFGKDFLNAVDIAQCTFGTNDEHAPIHGKDQLRKKMDTWAHERNRIIVGGGSWENAFEKPGIALKQMLGDKLFRETLGDQNIRMFGICFFNQVLGDMVGSLPPPLGAAPARTERGPLEIGLARITPTGSGQNHPLFKDCGEAFTSIMSRGGHLRGDDLHEQGKVMKTLARSGSGGTAAWEAFDGRISGIQWHPEVRCVEPGKAISSDSAHVLCQLKDHRQGLRKTFDGKSADVIRNFDAKRADIQADAGPEVLTNALLHLLTQTQEHLR